MEATAYIKNVAISPKKVRFLLAEVKRMPPVQALHHLRYTNKESAKYLYKAIQSAVTNAKNTLSTAEDMLQFKVLTVEEGRKLKRYRAGGRGMAKPYVHKYSHIKVVLTARNVALPQASLKKESAQTKEAVKPKAEESKKAQPKRQAAAPRVSRRTSTQPMVKQRTVTRQKKG